MRRKLGESERGRAVGEGARVACSTNGGTDASYEGLESAMQCPEKVLFCEGDVKCEVTRKGKVDNLLDNGEEWRDSDHLR